MVELAPPPEGCVTATASTPQDVPLHPAPESVQESTVLGFDPATGVRVAVIVADPPLARLAGAASCKEKLLVTVTVAVADFDGSAALCAVSATPAGFGRICGAV